MIFLNASCFLQMRLSRIIKIGLPDSTSWNTMSSAASQWILRTLFSLESKKMFLLVSFFLRFE